MAECRVARFHCISFALHFAGGLIVTGFAHVVFECRLLVNIDWSAYLGLGDSARVSTHFSACALFFRYFILGRWESFSRPSC